MTSGPAEFQGALVRLGSGLDAGVAKLTGALARFDRGEAMRYVTDAYPELATPYIAAAGDLSATWYEEQPARAGARAFFAKPAQLPTVEQLAANGRWSLTQANPSKSLQGAGRRAIFNESRDTIAENAEEEGVRWVRHARAGACGFCRMLATRVLTVGSGGAPGLYRSEGSASRNTHRANAQGHDFCRCVAVPLRGGAEYVVPDYLPQWLDDYEAVSRDADGRLYPAQTIANRMEALGRERGERPVGAPRRRAPGPDPGPGVVDLDAPAAATRDRVAGVQQLTERNAVRAEEAIQPVRDRVAQAAAIAERADEVVTTAAAATTRVKQVTDVADKLLGGSVPIVRTVKQIVDAADQGLQTAAGVTGPAVQVARLADRTLDSTVGIAHGVKQIADDALGLLDEGVAIAVAARALVTDSARVARDVGSGEGGLSRRVAEAVEDARRIQSEAGALAARARGTVDTAAGIVQGVAELPAVMAKPVADIRALAGEVRDAAAAVEQAVAEGAAVVASARRLMDAIADWRAAQAAADTVPRGPVRVASERLDGPPAIEAADSIRAPGPRPLPPRSTQPAIEAAGDVLDAEVVDLPAGPLMLTAGPQRLAIEAPKVTPPDPGAIAEWLDAEDAHRHALEYWRRVDAEDLHGAPPRPAVAVREVLDDVIDVPPAAPATVEETAMNRAVREFEEAIATGDNDLIERTAAAMEALEDAENAAAAKIAAAEARRAKAADRRAERGNAESDEMLRRIEAGNDPILVEAEVMMRRPENQRKVRDLIAKEGASWVLPAGETAEMLATRRVENDLIQRFRRRDFIAEARADGHSGKGFDDLIGSVFERRVDELALEAENATNGQMTKPRFRKSYNPKQLWYTTDRRAREVMSDEMAAWFDENGRLTRQVLRQMVLDGNTNWRAYNVMGEDYLQ